MIKPELSANRRTTANVSQPTSSQPAGTRRMPVIGLTGPMCAGKNEAGKILARHDFSVVDADVVAHQALDDVRTEVIAAFGELAKARGLTLENPDGSIDRRTLGSLIFSDPALLVKHEAIIYPRINEILGAFIENNSDRPVVINAPLLHKSPVLAQCDFVIFVDACVLVRFFRALRRDRMPIRHIFARFSAQKHLFTQYLLKNVDIVRVQNKGSIRALEKRLIKLLTLRGY